MDGLLKTLDKTRDQIAELLNAAKSPSSPDSNEKIRTGIRDMTIIMAQLGIEYTIFSGKLSQAITATKALNGT